MLLVTFIHILHTLVPTTYAHFTVVLRFYVDFTVTLLDYVRLPTFAVCILPTLYAFCTHLAASLVTHVFVPSRLICSSYTVSSPLRFTFTFSCSDSPVTVIWFPVLLPTLFVRCGGVIVLFCTFYILHFIFGCCWLGSHTRHSSVPGCGSPLGSHSSRFICYVRHDTRISGWVGWFGYVIQLLLRWLLFRYVNVIRHYYYFAICVFHFALHLHSLFPLLLLFALPHLFITHYILFPRSVPFTRYTHTLLLFLFLSLLLLLFCCYSVVYLHYTQFHILHFTHIGYVSSTFPFTFCWWPRLLFGCTHVLNAVYAVCVRLGLRCVHTAFCGFCYSSCPDCLVAPLPVCLLIPVLGWVLLLCRSHIYSRLIVLDQFVGLLPDVGGVIVDSLFPITDLSFVYAFASFGAVARFAHTIYLHLP